LGENQALAARVLSGDEEEQGLAATGQRPFVGRAADVDMNDEACRIAEGEAGGTARAFSSDVGPARSGPDFVGQSSARKIAPSVRAASQARPPRPSLGDRDRRLAFIPRALGRREVRLNSAQGPQHLAHLAEVETGLEVLDESEDVALGVAVRVPPACPAMRDDDDLARPVAVFKAALRAFLAIEKPWRRRLLEHGRAVDAGAQLFNLSLRVLHPLFSLIGAGRTSRAFPCLPAFTDRAHREAPATQGRAERAGASDGPLRRRRR